MSFTSDERAAIAAEVVRQNEGVLASVTHAGEPIRVTKYIWSGSTVGAYDAAPGAVVAMHYR